MKLPNEKPIAVAGVQYQTFFNREFITIHCPKPINKPTKISAINTVRPKSRSPKFLVRKRPSESPTSEPMETKGTHSRKILKYSLCVFIIITH